NSSFISFFLKMPVNGFPSFFLDKFFFLTNFLFNSRSTFPVYELGEIIGLVFHGVWGKEFLLASWPQAASISLPLLLRSLALTLFFSRCFINWFTTDSSGFANSAFEIGLYSMIFTRSAGTWR